jgi:hypothetical protein
LPKKIRGVADETTSAAIGHTRRATARGVTDSYIGDVDYNVFSARVENAYKYRRALAIRAPYKKVRLTPKETTDFYIENNLDPTSVNNCRKA